MYTCTCSGGYPKSGPNQCYGGEDCLKCHSDYKLVNGSCNWNHTCTCSNGTPKGPGYCFGGENCHSCNSGYVILGNLCTRYYTGNVIRSGDTIGLKSNCGSSNRWLSNWCTVNCGWKSTVQSCPGWRFDQWDYCVGEEHVIVAEGKATGEAINYGDVIGLYYAHATGYWFSCQGKKYRVFDKNMSRFANRKAE